MYRLSFILLIVALSFFTYSCQKKVKVETEEYSIKLPSQANFINNNIDTLDQEQNLFAVIVFRKNKTDYLSIDDCLSSELPFMLEGKNSYNVVSFSTSIDGKKALISRGVNILKNRKIFWLVAVVQTKYYYYIIRVISGKNTFKFNELQMEKIANSFHLKSNEI